MRNFYNKKKRIVKEQRKEYQQQYDKREIMDVSELKTEQRISYLAASCRTKTPRRELIDIAKKFSQNLDNGEGENSMKYVYIYKNLLRDMKIYYLQQY
jgi:hypothetical protein